MWIWKLRDKQKISWKKGNIDEKAGEIGMKHVGNIKLGKMEINLKNKGAKSACPYFTIC